MTDDKTGFIMKDKKEGSNQSAKTGQGESTDSDPTQLPEINFATFIISLNASALLNLGAIEDPSTGEKTKNLPMAKQTIDILTMLEEKTRGNLTDEEEKILKNVLYDLRIIYVRETK